MSTGVDKSAATDWPFTVTLLVVKLDSATTGVLEVSEAGVSTLTDTAWCLALYVVVKTVPGKIMSMFVISLILAKTFTSIFIASAILLKVSPYLTV